jgi:hypothetical protein
MDRTEKSEFPLSELIDSNLLHEKDISINEIDVIQNNIKESLQSICDRLSDEETSGRAELKASYASLPSRSPPECNFDTVKPIALKCPENTSTSLIENTIRILYDNSNMLENLLNQITKIDFKFQS